jgi:hypothetical protein
MIQFEVFIRNGQIDFQQYDRKRWYRLISEQKNGEYVLSLKKKKKRRSNEQLRYLWGVVYKMISDETGLSVRFENVCNKNRKDNVIGGASEYI